MIEKQIDLDEISDDSGKFASVEGIVEHIVYQNEANGYCVCEIALNDEKLITAVGTLPYLACGERIKANGEWTVHPSFGRQFKIDSYEKQLPTTPEEVLHYLSSGTVKGIGPKLASRIVEHFGPDTMDVLENHSDWLLDIKGITQKKADEISEDFNKKIGMHSVMMFCRNYFGPAVSAKIYNKWGGGAIDVIRANPYQLCDDINGISFERADRVAAGMGLEKDSDFRIRAAICYILSYNAAANGHVYIPRARLAQLSVEMLEISTEKAEDNIDWLSAHKKLVCVKRGRAEDVYLKAYYDAEIYTANKLDMLDRLCPAINSTDAELFIQQTEQENGLSYASLQKKAILSALKNGVTVLTGGPGTGKTTVIKALLRIFGDLGYECALAAPTGRAAKRMSEATSDEAKTIHRMLEMEYNENDDTPHFVRDEKNQLEENVIIIDEMSMVDSILMSCLLKAVKPGCRLVLIGDADQLPSVGAGNVLREIINSDRFSTVRLKEVFRQAGESLIITNAHSINSGELPNLDNKDSDFFFLSRNTDKEIANTVCNLYCNRLPKSYGEEIIPGMQIITPSRKGEAGTLVLNKMIQSAVNPPSQKKAEIQVRDTVFRVGDKVMQIKNNYNINWTRGDTEGVGIFNGDTGIITSISKTEMKVCISFDEREAEYDFQMLEELELAYAVTVHKSQGCEYPVVIIPMYNFAPQLMTRNLLYTAVTRAQKMVVMVGYKTVVQRMVENNHRSKRYTALGGLLQSLSIGNEGDS